MYKQCPVPQLCTSIIARAPHMTDCGGGASKWCMYVQRGEKETKWCSSLMMMGCRERDDTKHMYNSGSGRYVCM